MGWQRLGFVLRGIHAPFAENGNRPGIYAGSHEAASRDLYRTRLCQPRLRGSRTPVPRSPLKRADTPKEKKRLHRTVPRHECRAYYGCASKPDKSGSPLWTQMPQRHNPHTFFREIHPTGKTGFAIAPSER
jgi:hypothetical protein